MFVIELKTGYCWICGSGKGYVCLYVCLLLRRYLRRW